MTKRARWDGPGTIDVFPAEDTQLQNPIVKGLEPGQLLPLENLAGEPVPASVRDEMLAKENWSEVNQADQSTKPADKKADDKKGDS